MLLRYTFLPLLLLVTCLSFSQAQTDSLIHSGYHLERAKILVDSGSYEKAIKELQFIDPRDTNYIHSLAELSNTYYANKQYEKAIAVSATALLQPSSLRSQLLVTQGMSYVEMEQYDKARGIFEAGMKEFPFYVSFLIQYGKLLYAQKQYEEAEKYFFHAMTMYPFNLTSHLYLAFIAIQRGEKTRGMMSMGIYMALNNSANNHLVTLERFVKNELTDEFSIPPSSDNQFTRLDEIIRSKIAMDDRYTTKIPINIGIVKQYQLLFEQLSAQEYSSNDPWASIYLPIYKSLIKANGQEAFIYHILKSTTIKQVPDWTKKNDKILEEFYSVMNKAIPVVRAKQTLPESWGYREPVSCWYTSNNRLESIGQRDAKKERTGLWYYFNDNGSIKAKGSYDHGKKIGLWKYFSESAIQSDVENFDTGERIHYDEHGSMKQKYVLRDQKLEGDLYNYFSCGNVREHIRYRNGLREGPAEVYSISGAILEKLNYVKDSINGPYQSYFETGELRQKSTFEQGKLNKTSTRYHQNGKIFSQGEYVKGNATGPWKIYHDNGKIKEEGQYNEDLPVGKFLFYDRKGILIETRNYNDKGEYHGDDMYFHNGKLHYRLTYRDNLIIAIAYFDRKGLEIASYANANGTFDCKGYFPTGELRSEFHYKNGEAAGTWKYYYRTGNLESVYEYNKVLNGKGIEYYPNKSIKNTFCYKDGELHGLYEGFTEHGKIQVRGWYQEGMPQQRWNSYYSNGKIKTDEYYLNNALTGESYNYDPDGKIVFRTDYREGRTLGIQYFNEKGEPNSTTVTGDGGRVTVSTVFKSGNKALSYELICGKYNGKVVSNFPDGRPYMLKQFVNDERSGKYEKYSVDGKLETTGNYQNGRATTFSSYFPNKTIETTGMYAEDERDSTWTYYHENGKLFLLSEYQNGKRDGITKIFAPDGQLVLEKLYDKGDLIAYRSRNSKDTLWISFTGTGTIKSNFSTGKLAYEESYLNGRLEGQRKTYFANGILFTQENFVKGLLDGLSIENSQNGKLRFKKNFEMDEATGKWEYYTIEGALERIENYSFGQLQGTTEFFNSGKRVKELKFWYGIPVE